MSARLVFIRHPPVDRGGRCIGQHTVPVIMPVPEAATRVLEQLDFEPKRIISSDLPRCANLARALSEHTGAPLQLEPQIREVSFGAWEGMSYDDIDREDSERWRAWCDDWIAARPPGGESAVDLLERVSAWLEAVEREVDTLVVTHAGVIRSLHVRGGLSWADGMGTKIEYLDPVSFDLD